MSVNTLADRIPLQINVPAQVYIQKNRDGRMSAGSKNMPINVLVGI